MKGRQLSPCELRALAAVENGATVYAWDTAVDLRAIHARAPELVELFPAERGFFDVQDPHFEARATPAGRQLLQDARARGVDLSGGCP